MSISTKLRRRAGAGLALSLASVGLVATAAAPAQAAPENVKNATLAWGISGYAQKGTLAPWRFKDFSGGATFLDGDVDAVVGTPQSEYLVDPVPATSFPTSLTGKSPNAVKLVDGEGTFDRATGAASLSWTGSYTVNSYPANINAPDEIFTDPQLTVNADGSGSLTAEYTLGAGMDPDNNPVPADELGRLTVATFSAGSLSDKSAEGYRIAPDYQGVAVPASVDNQATNCSPTGDATGWWGAWPAEFVGALDSTTAGQALVGHYYSSSCGGMQDNKPALPLDLSVAEVPAASVEVSGTRLHEDGTHTVTVTGEGFDPALAVGTRPPFAGVRSGTYIAFGKYDDVWRPSAGAPSTSRRNPGPPNGNGVAVIWAVPAASFAASNPPQDPEGAAYAILNEDGSFETEIKVERSWLADAAGNYGIYTYAGGGPNVAQYETYTPITFFHESSVSASAPESIVYGAGGEVTAQVTGSDDGQAKLTGAGPAQTVDLAEGAAAFTLPATLTGERELTVSFLGTPTADPSSTTASLTVVAATTKTAAKVKAKPTPKKKGKLQVTVANKQTSAQPGGKVSVVLKKGKATKKVEATALNKKGKVTLTLPKLAKGTWRATVTYAGQSGKFAESGKAFTLKVKKK